MKIRSEGPEGRPTAPRVASMLEIGKFGGCETSAAALAGWRDATAAPTTIPAARIAAGKFWFCHRDIVILKTRRGMARRRSDGATWRRCHDPGRAAGPCPAGRFLLSARNLPAHTHRRIAAASRPSGRQPRRCPCRSRAAARRSRRMPRSTNEQVDRANSVRIRNAP